jgi:BirA family biotin operon repressor/biotin-[acetyl-CoA-carboxylase] ligase
MTALADVPVLHFDNLDSTNEEALRRLAAGDRTPLWIVANEQTRGRGRSGRRWQSPAGNLYASLALDTGVSAAVATQLSFVAGLAAYDAVMAHLPADQLPRLRLKWPNDVMLGAAKLAGLLLESLAPSKGNRLAVILGIGINVAYAPPAADRAVACLGLEPADVPRVFTRLSSALETRLAQWEEGRGFPAIREAWLRRALALNESISVNLNGAAIRGKFTGVDAAGALQLETKPGVVITVTAGDIYPDALV